MPALTEESLNAVNDNHAQWTLVTVGEDFVELRDLLAFREANHGLR